MDAKWAPNGIVITKAGYSLDSEGDYTMFIGEYTNPRAASLSHTVVNLTTSVIEYSTQTLNHATIEAGNKVGFALTDTDKAWVKVWFTYYIVD